MGVMRKIIDWCDDTMAEAYTEDNTGKGAAKAFASGFVEGFCDAAVILYVPITIACFVYQAKLTKK